MRHRLVSSVACLLLALSWAGARAQQPAAPAQPYRLAVVTDRPEAFYSVGEKAKFVITLKKDGQPAAEGEVAYVLTKDGMPPVTPGTLKLENGAASVEGTLEEPGFLSCRVTFTDPEGKKIIALAGAGYDPTKIPTSMPVPDDFDAFWAAQKARLKEIPMDPKLTPVATTVQGIECFDVQIPCAPPRPVSGYFARPVGAKPKSLPAILNVQGAGVRSSGLGGPASQAKNYNALAMDINAHGIPNGQPEQFYKDLAQGELAGYPAFGREDREKCYFLGMFLRLVRAMEFLTSQPEWDGKTLIVQGSSQGGGQSIAAAGLDPRVTLICANVPAICDHSGKVVGRANGWPRLVPDKDGKPDPEILKVARYFDCMNLATRAKAEAVISVGFIDTTCAPTSVYATFNAWPGKKQLVTETLMGHASSPKIAEAFATAIKNHLAR